MGASDVQYSPLISLSPQEACLKRKAQRWVIFLGFIQMVQAILSFLSGDILMLACTVIFVTLGMAGIRHQRPRLLVAHFVYSLALYILSLIRIVLLIMYCDECTWIVYSVMFGFILIQVVGLRNSQALIALVRKEATVLLPTVAPCNESAPATTDAATQSSVTPNGPMNGYPMMAPFHPQFNGPMMVLPSGQYPQYYSAPVQNVQYPFQGVPMGMVPYPPQYEQNTEATGN